ncbi:MAG TPA: urease accessory protein UreE [Pseudobacteroides sp.]|nr:urease accessory protein UreE [Pseudobacteroides sp.]
MIADKVLYNLKDVDNKDLVIDFIDVEWFEVEKKILHKIGSNGMEIGIRNNGGEALKEGDVLWQDGNKVLVVRIPYCDCIAMNPQSRYETAKACYEMGNRHAPLFIEGDELLTPYDEPLMNALIKCGLSPYKKSCKLITPLGRHAHGHSHSHSH